MDTSTDPGGTPFNELTPELLRAQRSSVKWARYPADVLPLFVAEMDFAVAPEIRDELLLRVTHSDLGYLDGVGPLGPAFADFARDRWGWEVPHAWIHTTTDVATAVVEAVRVGRPDGGTLALATPTYPGFFEMIEELPVTTVQIPLLTGEVPRLDLARIAEVFAAGCDVFILCNPHNPHGLLHTADDLRELAQLAVKHDVCVVSDEIHAPLTPEGQVFTPFAPIAAEAGALAFIATSASKGWSIPGVKCGMLIAADERANRVLENLPPETSTRTSILGLHANVAAFSRGRDWLDRANTQIRENEALFAELVRSELPGIVYHRPQASYLAWLDCRSAGLGDDPHTTILREARVALNDGALFGAGGSGFVRLNLACAPDTLREAVRRIAAILPHNRGEG